MLINEQNMNELIGSSCIAYPNISSKLVFPVQFQTASQNSYKLSKKTIGSYTVTALSGS